MCNGKTLIEKSAIDHKGSLLQTQMDTDGRVVALISTDTTEPSEHKETFVLSVSGYFV
jgi:hypothetical protein